MRDKKLYEVTFIIPGEPVGKGRPRFARATGMAYTPEKTANFETLVKYEYHRQIGDKMFDDGDALGLRVEAYFSIPKSKPKYVQKDMELGVVRHTKKPDYDNIAKIITDALNKVAYHDDSAICYAEVTKKYSRTPHTTVTIWSFI